MTPSEATRQQATIRRSGALGPGSGRRNCGHFPNLSIPQQMAHLFADFHGGALTHVVAYIDTVPAGGHRRIGPQEYVARVDRRQIHATMAARGAEDVVPVRTVERVARRKIL